MRSTWLDNEILLCQLELEAVMLGPRYSPDESSDDDSELARRLGDSMHLGDRGVDALTEAMGRLGVNSVVARILDTLMTLSRTGYQWVMQPVDEAVKKANPKVQDWYWRKDSDHRLYIAHVAIHSDGRVRFDHAYNTASGSVWSPSGFVWGGDFIPDEARALAMVQRVELGRRLRARARARARGRAGGAHPYRRPS
jgi:hypothetical protein